MRAVKEVQQKLGAPSAAAQPAAGAVGKARSYPGRARQFLRDVRQELNNVTWPSWKDTQATTVVVLVATFFFGFYLGMALDVPFGRLMGWLLRVGRELLG
ncbi:MAG: preprotein translocase subunit SecE [Terriglobia bacterium]